MKMGLSSAAVAETQFIRITLRSFCRQSIFNDYSYSLASRKSKTDDQLLLVVNGIDAALLARSCSMEIEKEYDYDRMTVTSV